MALIICPECGGKLSDKADFCPHCGYNQFKCEEEKVLRDICEKKDTQYNKYLDMTEKELNLLVEKYIKRAYPQLFGHDVALQQKESFDILRDVFVALEKINSSNKLVLMTKRFSKEPYLHLALFIATSHYIAISKNYLEKVLNTSFSDAYTEIGLHLEVMTDDFGEVYVLEEKYNDFLQFSSLYSKIRFKEKNEVQGNYIIYQYGSSVDNEHQLPNAQVSLHLGDCCAVDKEMRQHMIEKTVWDSPAINKQSNVNFAKRAAIGGIIAGPVGAIVGVASGIDKDSKLQENNNSTNNYHIEYVNDDSYILSLTSNIVWGMKFSFLINEHRANYIRFDNTVYEKMDELYIELKKKLLLAQRYRQQMFAWMSVNNDISGFCENSDEALECLKYYNENLYDQINKEIQEKKKNETFEKEKKKNQYILGIEEKEKALFEWQEKYDLYKNKKFGEGKKMKDYCYSQLVKFQEEIKSLKEALDYLEG